jgi:glutamate:GABA antiporter
LSLSRTLPRKPSGPSADLPRELGLRDLSLFAIACLIAPRWISVAAHAGPASITLWVAAALLFAAPLAVAVSALMSKYPGAGGFYLWTRNDFGPWHGFLAFWAYAFSMAAALPGAAMFAVSTTAASLAPSLASNRAFVLLVSLAAIWLALGTNLIGMKIGKWTENAGGATSWLLGAMLAAAAACIWARRGSATPLSIAPTLDWDTLSFFGSVAFALSGVEALGLMGAEIRSPERVVAPAAWIGTVFASMFYIVTTLSLLVLLHPQAIEPLSGIADATAQSGLPAIAVFVALLVLINAVGYFGGWASAVARLPYAAGSDRLLPEAFARVHPKWQTPHVSLLSFGALTSAILILMQLGDGMRAAYQALLSFMVITGFFPYLYMFVSAWKCGRWLSSSLGLATTALAIAASVVPGADVESVWLFEGKLLAGTLVMIAAAWLVYRKAAA